MNKSLKSAGSNLTFGDLVAAVSTSSRNSREAVAVIADMIQTGQVTFIGKRHRSRRSSH